MRELVLDAWGVVEWLEDRRPAADHIQRLLDAADRGECRLLMNIINLGEVFYVSVKRRGLEYGNHALHVLHPRLATISTQDDLVMFAAKLKARHRISYADGFAAATAILQDIPLVTGDPELRAMTTAEKSLRIEWIGH